MINESDARLRLAPLLNGLPGNCHAPTTELGATAQLVSAAQLIDIQTLPDTAPAYPGLAEQALHQTTSPHQILPLAEARSTTQRHLAQVPDAATIERTTQNLIGTLRALLIEHHDDNEDFASHRSALLQIGAHIGRALESPPDVKPVDGLTHLMDTLGFGPDEIKSVSDRFWLLHEALHSTDAHALAFETHYLRLPGAIGQWLHADLMANSNDPTAARAALGNTHVDALRSLSAPHLDREDLEDLATKYRADRTGDRHPLFTMVGTYPFDPANPMFDETRDVHIQASKQAVREGANPMTRAWIDHNAAVIPVLISINGTNLAGTPSTRLFAEIMGRIAREAEERNDPEHFTSRIVCAQWDAARGRAVAIPLTPPARGSAAILAAYDGSNPDHQANPPKLPIPLPDHADPVDPEALTELHARPGAPLFVLVREEDIYNPMTQETNASPTGQPGEESETITYVRPYRDGPNEPNGVHAQSLALTVAARLGGARNIAVLTSEASQAQLFSDTTRTTPTREGSTLEHTVRPAINLPLHHAIIGLIAQGAGSTRVAIHKGAPWGADQDLIHPNRNNLGKLIEPANDNPLLLDAFRMADGSKRGPLDPAPWLAQLAAWLHASAHRPGASNWRYGKSTVQAITSIPDRPRTVQIVRAFEARPVRRIALLLSPNNPEEIKLAVRLSRHGLRSDSVDHDYLVPEPLLRTQGFSQTLRTTLRAHYSHLAPTDPHLEPSATARLVPATANEIHPDQCNLVLVGGLSSGTPEDFAMLDLLGRCSHPNLPILLLAPSALGMLHDRAMVWGEPEERRLRWGLNGEALQQHDAPSDVGRLLAAQAQDPRLGTLIVHRAVAQIPPIAPDQLGPERYSDACTDPDSLKALEIPAQRLRDALRPREMEKAPAIERPGPITPPELAGYQIDRRQLHRQPSPPTNTEFGRSLNEAIGDQRAAMHTVHRLQIAHGREI